MVNSYEISTYINSQEQEKGNPTMPETCLCAKNIKHVMLSFEKHLAELKKQNHELQLRNSELVLQNRQLKATSQLGKNHARP